MLDHMAWAETALLLQLYVLTRLIFPGSHQIQISPIQTRNKLEHRILNTL